MSLDRVDGFISGQLDGQATRRKVLKTGVRIAYATPLVAASFKLSSGGALAATCDDDQPYQLVDSDGFTFCCGCCDGSGGNDLSEAFELCAETLADKGITCAFQDVCISRPVSP